MEKFGIVEPFRPSLRDDWPNVLFEPAEAGLPCRHHQIHHFRRIPMGYFLSLLLATSAIVVAAHAPAEGQQAPRKLDLADIVAGTYEGSVVADTRGGSQSDIVITVRRISKNVVEVSCDYARVPTVNIGLTRASDAILNSSGHNGFLIQQGGDPKRLDLSIDGATLIVHKR